MKKILLSAAALMMATSMWAQTNEISLDLTKPTNPESLNYEDDGSGMAQVWSGCYEGGNEFIEFGIFALSHSGQSNWWHGFCPSISSDITNYNEAGEAFFMHAWNAIAGGGIKTDENGKVVTGDDGKVEVDPEAPFLTAYWSSYNYYMGEPSLQVIFNDGKTYEAKGVYVTNNCYPYYGNLAGDGFARALDQEGDHFTVTAIALDEDYEDTDNQVTFTLASCTDGVLTQVEDWQWMDLSALGEVYGINFIMDSTDSGQWGINTATYFCMDKLTVKDPSITTAVTEGKLNKTVAGVDYVNLAGQRSSTAFDGVNIVVTRYTDGTTSTTKVIR